MARLDIESLQKAGLSVTLDDVIYLNDLALEIESGKETTPQNAPRMAFAGNVVFHEMTIGAIEWWFNFGKNVSVNSDMLLKIYYFAHVNARNLEYLFSLQEESQIKKAVKKWIWNIEATESELIRAFLYVQFGDKGIPDSVKEDIYTSIDQKHDLNTIWQLIIAASGNLNIRPEDLKTCTVPVLVGILQQSNAVRGIKMSRNTASNYIAYTKRIKDIENRNGNVRT